MVELTALPDHRFRVIFADGTGGEVRMRTFLQSSEVDGTVFEALREEREFCQARVEMGAIVWPNGADVAPDAMYDAIRQHGYWEP